MPPSLLRFALVCEFLLAFLTVNVAWGQIGGQNHLDAMPWYDKFALTFTLSLIIVCGTLFAMTRNRAWNRVSIACFFIGLILVAAMGAVTYYYHLQEENDDDDDDDTGVALVHVVAPEPRG